MKHIEKLKIVEELDPYTGLYTQSTDENMISIVEKLNQLIEAFNSLQKEPSVYGQDYSHNHCWAQGTSPACGIPLGEYIQCCLCPAKIPGSYLLTNANEISSKLAENKATTGKEQVNNKPVETEKTDTLKNGWVGSVDEMIRDNLIWYREVKDADHGDLVIAEEAIKTKVRSLLLTAKAEEQQKVKKNIGMLRQWLNEKPADMLVTNEQLETWLFNDK